MHAVSATELTHGHGTAGTTAPSRPSHSHPHTNALPAKVLQAGCMQQQHHRCTAQQPNNASAFSSSQSTHLTHRSTSAQSRPNTKKGSGPAQQPAHLLYRYTQPSMKKAAMVEATLA